MAKIYGLFGSMTGKLADVVMVVRNGEQVARKYQPVVANPSTSAQIQVRAKLKLLSQLSAVMAPVIAIRKEGSVSSRNLFTKINYQAVTWNNTEANVVITSVQLTKSAVTLPSISFTRDNDVINVSLRQSNQTDLSRVVYCLFAKESDNTLRFAGSNVVTSPGTNNKFPSSFTLDNPNETAVIFAYGLRDNSENARAVFGNLTVPTAETVAKLVTTSTLLDSDITITKTQAIESVPSNAMHASSPDGDAGNSSSKKK